MSFDTLVLAPFSHDGLNALNQLGSVTYEPWTKTQTLHDPEELGQRITAEAFRGLIVEADFLFGDLFAAAPSLRFAAVARAALNQVDLDAATDYGVAIVHTPGRNAQAVAEMVIALMFGLARQMPLGVAYVNSGQWQDPTEPYVRFQGRELAGSTLGVIGFGEIGRRTAMLAKGLGMRVLAHDPFIKKAPRHVTLTGLDELLRESNFISIHVPDTPETASMLDAARIGHMRPGTYLVNVTAPSVVDQAALAQALKEGRLAGVALDVHESHPLAPNAPFLELAKAGHNVLLTPHLGGATLETVERHSQMIVDDLHRFLAGKRPKHLANPAVWRGPRKS